MGPSDVAFIVAIGLGVLWLATSLPQIKRSSAVDGSSIAALVDQLGMQRNEIAQLRMEIEALKSRLTESELQRNAMQTELEAWRRQNQRIAELECENESLRRAILNPVGTGLRK